VASNCPIPTGITDLSRRSPKGAPEGLARSPPGGRSVAAAVLGGNFPECRRDQRRLPSGTSRAGLVRGQRQFNAGLFPRPDTQCCSADYRAPRSGQRPPLPRARSPSHGTPVLVAAGLGTPKDIGVGNCPRGPDLALSLLAQADSRPYLLAEVNLQFAITNLQFAMNPAAHRDNVRNDTPNAAMSPSPSECHPLDCGCFKMQNAKCKMTSGSIIQAVRPGKARRPPEERRFQ
jgi:hypothetical protein